ncbi:hypothetical protein DAI22_04g180200 [Oryza sativa Japonica Group]|nr:hypothetical protein DAI22_04g180200 [Oryza sativa Japonica Group]
MPLPSGLFTPISFSVEMMEFRPVAGFLPALSDRCHQLPAIGRASTGMCTLLRARARICPL